MSSVELQQLLQWLDPDLDQAGGKYERIRNRLIRYFISGQSVGAEAQADKTINRVAKIISKKGAVYQEHMALFLSVANKIRLEGFREQSKYVEFEEDDIDRIIQPRVAQPDDLALDKWERDSHLDCLQSCLQMLSPEDRSLIICYYDGGDDEGANKRNRKRLADHFGITTKALSSRVLRLREKLESWIKECVEAARAK